jgi:hypothetical protein
LKQEKETPIHLLRENKRDIALKSVEFYFELDENEAQKKLCQFEKKISEVYSN